MSRIKVEHMQINTYKKYLVENSRPPSKGGNTSAWHRHVLEIDAEKYSFLALGSQQWVFRSDTISFEYELKNGYRNIALETIATLDNQGRHIVRGNRSFKSKLRTAVARMPASRREQRD